MIRKVYLDFIRQRFFSRDIRWLLVRGVQYALVHASALVCRPLCGPVLGTLVTNYRCNYRCVMCDLPGRDREQRARGRRELDTGQMKQVLRDFSRLGVSGIGFTGGEPLLRRDIFELLAYTRELGMISHLNTNGSLLDDAAAERILAAGTDSINISLDGACPATHDVLRGVPGAFDLATAAVRRIHAARGKAGAKLRIKTVAVLGEENIGEVRDLVHLAAGLGADCIEFIPRQPFVRGAGDAPPADPVFLNKVEDAVAFLAQCGSDRIAIENSPTHLRLFARSFRGEASPLRCYAAYSSLAVDCYGDVYPCVPWYNWQRPVGTIGNVDLPAFWYSRAYDRSAVSSCRECYLNCQAELNILFNPFHRVNASGGR